METLSNKKKVSKKNINKNSAAYIKQRQKANARKRKYLDNLTTEQRLLKKAKDREYYQKKKAANKTKRIEDMTEREKRKQRALWKKNSTKYRQRKKNLVNILNDTPPLSEAESMNNDTPRSTKRRREGRKLVRKDRAKAYRTIAKQSSKMKEMQRKIDSMKKKIERQKRQDRRLKASRNEASPNTKVDNLIRGSNVTADIRKQLLFAEVITSQLQVTANSLPKNSKEREAFQKSVSGKIIKKYRMLKMTKKFLPKNRTNNDILTTDVKRRVCIVTPEIRSEIVNFFEKDEVSRMCPGKRDFIRRGATKKQKRILLNTVKDLNPKFMKDTGINLSYITLLREKPFWVINPTAKDRDTCLCVRHENFTFIVNKLYRENQINFGNVSKLIKDVSCDETSYDCMFSLCDKCDEMPMTASENDENSINYFQWQSTTEERLIRGEKKAVKMVKKVLVNSTIKDLKSKMEEEIPVMKKHIYGIYYHSKVKDDVKKSLKKNEIMMQIDFSENYVTKYDREIQSTHFGASKTQLTIHTGVYYHKDDNNNLQTSSFATISDCLDHQAHAVWGHLRPILTSILVDKEYVDTLFFFSDGPTSQYRNRTNIYLWLKTLVECFQQVTKAAWFYSEPGHGKGPMDGIGGYLKRTADKHVLMGKDVKSAEDFIEIFTDSSVMLQKITTEEILSIKSTVPEKIDPVPGILRITKITWKSEFRNVIKIDQHGKNQREVKLNILFSGDTDVQLESSKPRKSIYHEVYSSSSTSEDEDIMTVHRNEKEREMVPAVGTSCATDFKDVHYNKIMPGTFLLINVPTKRKNMFYRYVGIAETCVDEEGEIKVTFLKSIRNNARDFKVDYKDISYVTYEQVLKIIPKPESTKGANNNPYYHFNNDIDIYEKF